MKATVSIAAQRCTCLSFFLSFLFPDTYSNTSMLPCNQLLESDHLIDLIRIDAGIFMFMISMNRMRYLMWHECTFFNMHKQKHLVSTVNSSRFII